MRQPYKIATHDALFNGMACSMKCWNYEYTIKKCHYISYFFQVGLWCLTPLSTIFQYIVAASFIGGGNRVPRENHRPVVSHWQTLSHNVVSPEWDSNSQH
jgi:hypothetical protein